MHELRFGVFALLPLLPVAASTQESDQSLAEQLANPISSLISVPLPIQFRLLARPERRRTALAD
jgi:glutamate formiminotransferase